MKYLTLLLFLSTFRVFGLDTLLINGNENSEALGRYMHYFTVDSGAVSADQAYQHFLSGNGTTSNEHRLNLGFYDVTDAWLFLTLKNNTTLPQSGVVFVDNLHLERLNFYITDKNELKLEAIGGDWVKMSDRTYRNIVPFVKLNLAPGESKSVLIKIYKDHSSLRIPVFYSSDTNYQIRNAALTMKNGMYTGIFLICFMLGVAFFILMRQYIFLVYALYVLGNAVYLLVNFGVALEYLYPETPTLNDFFRSYAAVMNTLIFVFFSIILLPVKKRLPKVYQIIITAFTTKIIILVVSILFNNFFYAYFNYVYSTIYFLMFVELSMLAVAAVALSRDGFFVARIYLGAYSILIIGVTLLFGREFGFIPDNWVVSNLAWTSVVLEVFVLVLALAYNIRLELLEKLRLSRLVVKQQEDLFTRIFEGREEERKLIASTLHDSVAGNLLAVQYSISKENNPVIHNLLKDTFQQVRQLSHDLYPPGLRENGLKNALQLLKERFSKQFRVEIKIEGMPDILSETRQLLIYRITQELLTNSAKHAKAKSVLIQVRFHGNICTLKVVDDGVGLSASAGEGIGLRSIKTRLGDYNGTSFTIKKGSAGGTEATVVLPVI